VGVTDVSLPFGGTLSKIISKYQEVTCRICNKKGKTACGNYE
jgi:hypothetical protein